MTTIANPPTKHDSTQQQRQDMKPELPTVMVKQPIAIYRLRRLAVSLALLGLTGCAVGPDFARPAAPDVDQYTATEAVTQTVSAPGPLGNAQTIRLGTTVQAKWWRDFKSDELNALIDQAFQNSPTLASAQAKLREAQELLAAYAGSNQLPQVTGAAGAQRQQTSPSSQGLSGDTRQFSLYNASVGVFYNLDVAGGIARQVQALSARVDFRQYELQAAQLTLAGNIANTAITRAKLASQYDATAQILKAQDEQLRLANQRVRLGHASPDEALSLKAQAEQTRSQLPALQKQIQQADHLLAVFAGQAPGTGLMPSFTLSDFSLPSELPLLIPAELVRQRPDIQASEALMKAANAEYGVAISRMYPQLTISASTGTQALTTGALFGPGSAVWALLGQLTQPLFNAGLPAQSRAALAAFDASAANYQTVVLQSLREVADSLRAIDNDAQTLVAISAADTAARASVRSTQRRFDLGAASNLELLVIQQQAEQIRIQHVAAQAQRLSDSVALYLAVGGGLESPPPPPAMARTTNEDTPDQPTPL